jgi:ribosome maturation factor RimP
VFLPVEIERIADDIRREVEALGAELVDIQFRRSGGRGTLTILADKAGGISLDECAAINRALGVFLDRLSEDTEGAPAALRGSYYLEVNSPGLDRPLREERDFKRAAGEFVKLVWRNAEGKTYDLRGRLAAVENGVLKIERLPDGQSVDLPLEAVVKAVRDVKI